MKNFIFTVILLGIIIYFSGGISLNKLSPKPQNKDIKIAAQRTQQQKSQEIQKQRIKPVKSDNYSGFHPQPIPNQVIIGAKRFNYYSFLFNRSGKIVLYSYGPGSSCPYAGQPFHDDIQRFRSSSDVNSRYYFSPVTIQTHNKIDKASASSMDKAVKNCNSSPECLRKAVDDYNAISYFIQSCIISKICIINNSKKQYISVDRNIQNASKALNDLKNW